jgi:ABC-type transporter Mla subunit MlaD
LAISGDTDTGFYGVAANDLGLSVGGAQVCHWNSTGQSLTGALAVSGAITSPTITAASTSLSQISSSLSNANTSITGVSSSLVGVKTSLTGVSTSLATLAGVTGVSTSVSQISSSLSQTNTSLANVSSSLGNVSTSLSSTNSVNVTQSTSLSQVSASLSSTNSNVAAITWPGTYAGTKAGGTTLAAGEENKTWGFGNAGTSVYIPANASVPLPVGTFYEMINQQGSVCFFSINSDTLYSTFGTGQRTIANNGCIGVRKITTTTWIVIYGFGIS